MDDIKRHNEEIAEKFIKIETALLFFPDGKQLFEKVLIRLEEEFDIPFVWISMINRPCLSGLIHSLATSQILKDRINIIDEATFFNLVTSNGKPILINDGIKPYFKLLPKKKKYFIRSLAIAPITLHQEIIGSLNHGDSSTLRYQPDMDTSLLQKLASHISTRLSEIIPVEKTDDIDVDESRSAD